MGIASGVVPGDEKRLLPAGNVDAGSKSAVGAGRRAHG
jgi:hypothetical protein